MLFQHSLSITQQLIPIYNSTVHKNNSPFALNVVTCWCYVETPTCYKGEQSTTHPASAVRCTAAEVARPGETVVAAAAGVTCCWSPGQTPDVPTDGQHGNRSVC